MSDGRSTDSFDAQVARLRGGIVHALNQYELEKAITYLFELHRLDAPRLWEAMRVVRRLHMRRTPDPRAERWLVRLVARIAIEHELDLAGLDELLCFAERYATDHEAQEAIERYCDLPSQPAES